MTIPVFGNGDVTDPKTAKYFKDNYGVDGLMIGRASYGNPWIFREIKHYFKTGELLPPPYVDERIRISILQLERSVAWKGERRGVLEMRKHWSDYFKNYTRFKPFRIKLMNAETLAVVKEILEAVGNFYR